MKRFSSELASLRDRFGDAVRYLGVVLAVVLICAGVIGLLSCSQPGGAPGGNGGKANNGGSSKTITTYAGTGFPGATGDNGPALQALLNSPYGICFDSVGYLYIADHGNSEVRVVNTAHSIFCAAGTGTAGYNGDNISPTTARLNQPPSIAVDPSGNIFVADEWNDRIRKVSALITTAAGTGSPTFGGDGAAATAASVAFPTFVFFDKSGNLYIADQGNNRVRVINASTGFIGTVAGNGSTGPVVDGGQATATTMTSPCCAIVDSSGNIYISQPNNNVVRKVNSSGVISTYAGTGIAGYSGDGKAATSANLKYPTALAFDGSGDLYIADSWNCVIREVNASTRVITTVVGTGTPGFSPDGTAATSAELNTPMGIAFDGSGTLYVADTGNNVIRVVK